MRVKLSDITEYSKGVQINGDDLIENGEFIYLNGGINPSGRWDSTNVPGNTVTISEGGNSSGYVNYISEPFWCGAHCYYLYGGPKNSKYLYYALKSQQDRLFSIRSGACMPNIKKTDLGNFEFEFDSDENRQNEVVSVLTKVESVVVERKKELNLLDELIKARFVEMFGIPIDRAKANMKFTDCVDFNPKKSEIKDLQDVEVSFVPMECVGVDGSFTIRENGPVSSYYKGYTYFRDGDVLLAKITPCFENGKAAIAEGCKNGIGFGTTEFHVARPKEGVSNSYWIKYMLKNDTVHDLATINMTGSAGQKRIQTPFFEKLTIFCPPIELQNQFAEFVKQVDKSKVVVQKALDEAQILFDSLMQEYFG